MGIAYLRSFGIGDLFVCFVVSVIRIEQVRKLSNLMSVAQTKSVYCTQVSKDSEGYSLLLVNDPNFEIIEFGISKLLPQTREWILEPILQILGVRSAVCGSCCRHN